MPFDLVIKNTSEVLTCAGPLTGPAEALLAPTPKGAVGIRGERITFLGPAKSLPLDAIGPNTRVINAAGGFAGPGLIDPHTHVVFAGDRSGEFEARCQGKTYLELAQAGGGIVKTVSATRAASEDELLALARPRLHRLLAQGVTTVEIKSGYGLDLESELKLLRVIRRLGEKEPATVVATLLALHALPPEAAADRARYVAQVADELVPKVAKERLASFCDAFVEQSAFTADEARLVLGRAKALGLTARLHVDQLTPGAGAELAAELGAATADHLEQISQAGIAALAKSGVVAVLAPTSTLFARAKPYAPGRALRDAGVPVALCTNCNPGSSNSENVSLAMGLACLENGLTPAEAYLGFTRFAGLALKRPELGQLAVGGPADVVVYGCPSYRELPYHLAMNEVASVVRHGRLVPDQGGPPRQAP